MSASYKLLLATLVVLLHISLVLQSPVKEDLSTDILRLAKSAHINAFVDDEVDPCDNFYKYACGKWKRLQPARASKPKTTYLDAMHELYVRKSIDMLNADISKDVLNTAGDAAVDDLLKTFYQSCRNEDALELIGIRPILNVVNFKGGWPHVSSQSWYEYEYDWLRIIAELRRKLGVDILVGLEIVPDFEDKDMHRIRVGAPKLELGSKAAYLSKDYEELRDGYKHNIAHKLQAYFPEMPSNWPSEIAAQVLEVERLLAKGLPDNAKLSLKQTTRQRYAAELKAAYGSYVDLNRYLNLIFNQTIYMQVYESPEDYMSNLIEVIRQTPKMTIANYTMWRVLEKFEFAGEINSQQNDKWCVQKIIEYFPYQLEAMFYRNYNNLAVNMLTEVWNDIRQTFHEDLLDTQRSQWIAIDTREKIIQKMQSMKLDIVKHSDENRLFKERVTGLVLKHDKYYENLISYLQWKTEQNLAKLIEKPEISDVDVNLPKYQYHSNKLQVPVVFLQARFFWDVAYPTALKYSTIGFFLAQQMMHAFDSVGQKYDDHGYQRNLWDVGSADALDQRTNCLTRQYSAFKFRGEKVNDPQLVDKSMTDNAGLAIAYRSFRKSWERQPKEQNATLPLLDYTANQLFFLSFAQLWCTDYHKSFDVSAELPEPLRANGALSNSNVFTEAMHCSLGTTMNPQRKKCVVF